MSKLSAPRSIAGLLLFTVGIAWAARAPNSGRDQDVPPEMKEEIGIVRVWNAKDAPPLERDHTPEAQRGDAIVVELKHLELWFCQNVEEGAWQDEESVRNADAVVQRIIKERQLGAAVKAGIEIDESAYLVTPPDPSKLIADACRLANFVPKNESGVVLDVNDPNNAGAISEMATKASNFITNLELQKFPEYVLSINGVPLPGIVVEAPERETDWRPGAGGEYLWYQFRLQGHQNPEFKKVWNRLMQSAGTHFSNPSTISLSLPGQKKELFSNVTTDNPDARCRFNLLAVTEPTPTQAQQKQFKKGDAVYPLDERDLEGHVLKGRIVEEPDYKSESYLVHFEERGGTHNYSGIDLARLPPDLVPVGVVRVWNGKASPITEWEDAQINDVPQAKLGDFLVVELRNFEAWLARQIDNGFFQDDPLIVKASQASKQLADLIKAKRFAWAARVGQKIQRIAEDDTHIPPAAIIKKLQRDAKTDTDLAELTLPTIAPEPSEKSTPPEQTTAGPHVEPTRDAPAADPQAQRFLAPFEEAKFLLDDLVPAKLRGLILTINDIPLGITPDNSDYAPIAKTRRPAGDPKGDTYYWLHFSLKPKSTDVTKDEAKSVEEPFKRLFAHPTFTMPSKVTLTLKTSADTLILPTAVTNEAADVRSRFNLIGIEKFKFWPMVFVFVLILGSLAFFAASTDILRDPSRRRPEGVEPVSLARTQMAFWFVVIAAAFAFLWVTTGNIDTINGTCLTLLAIGTTTALTTMAVQGNRTGRKDLSDALQKTPHEMLKLRPGELKEAIVARKEELEATGATMAPDELAETFAILNSFEKRLDRFLKDRPKWCPRRLHYWRYRLRTVFEDLLTEEAGTYDFHRFQMLAWTLVLGSVFVFKVFADRTMPQFDSNLLLLMGISSGAYIGFKVAAPRKTADETPAEDKDETAKPG